VRAGYARRLRGPWRAGWYHHGWGWHHYWAPRYGWSGYSWYNGPHWGTNRWVNVGYGSWDFTNVALGGSPTYVWPQRYYIYVDPTIYAYYAWPLAYHLYGGPGLAYDYPAMVQKIPVE
jgi:hypothetical protein